MEENGLSPEEAEALRRYRADRAGRMRNLPPSELAELVRIKMEHPELFQEHKETREEIVVKRVREEEKSKKVATDKE